MADNENNPEAAQQDAPAPQFVIQKTMVKDISFEAPMGIKGFTKPYQPQVKLDVNTSGNSIAENIHEVVLTLTVTVKLEEEILYLVEIQQAGIFSISGIAEEAMRELLGSVCPGYLFPYAREAIDSLVGRGGFPPLNLAPIDFGEIYRNSLSGAAEGQQLN